MGAHQATTRGVDGRTLSDASLQHLRAYAATLAANPGRMRKLDIANAIGLSRYTVSRWINRYIIDTSGVDAEGVIRKGAYKQRGRGLTFAQEARLKEIVCGDGSQMQLSGVRWSRSDLQVAAKRALGVEINHHIAGNYLQAWGVEPKRQGPADLEASITAWLQDHPGEWWFVPEIAKGVGCLMQQANPVLMMMAEGDRVLTRVTEIKDKRHGIRIRTQYRLREDDAAKQLASLFGMVAHPTIGGRVVRGRAMHD